MLGRRAGLSCGKGRAEGVPSCGSGSVGFPCRSSCAAAGLGVNSTSLRGKGEGRVSSTGAAGLSTSWRTAGDALICVFGSHHPEGCQKRVHSRAMITELAVLSTVRLCTLCEAEPSSCQDTSCVNREMSLASVCPPSLQRLPQEQCLVHRHLHSAGGSPAVLASPLVLCTPGSVSVSHPAALVLLCCFPSTALLLYMLILVQPPMTYSRVAVFA